MAWYTAIILSGDSIYLHISHLTPSSIRSWSLITHSLFVPHFSTHPTHCSDTVSTLQRLHVLHNNHKLLTSSGVSTSPPCNVTSQQFIFCAYVTFSRNVSFAIVFFVLFFLTCKQTFQHVWSSSLNRQVSQLTPVKNLWLYTEPDGVQKNTIVER